MSIALVISIVYLLLLLVALYWAITLQLAPLLGDPIGRWIRIAFWVIVLILLVGFLTHQFALPILALTIATVIDLLILAIVLYFIYWVVATQLGPAIGPQGGKILLIGFWVIVIIILIGLITGQVPLPVLF